MNKTQKIVLLILLILLSVAIRLQNTHQTDFDSYWLHAQAESIQLHENALWVYHPTSLFGYYPLSYPSGVPFFLAMFSEMSGLSMNLTVGITSVLVGLLVVFMTFLVVRELYPNWLWAYGAAMLVSLSPIIVNYSSFNAGGRIFIMPFYLLFFWAILRWYKERNFKYALLIALSGIFAFFVHRTAQLLVIFILAALAAWFYEKIPAIWEYIRTHRHYKKHVHPRYEKSKYYLLLDLGTLFFIAVLAKIGDLISRNRLGYNVERIVEPATSFIQTPQANYIFLGFFGLLLLFAIAHIILHYFWGINFVRKPFDLFHHHYHSLFEKPQQYFLLFVALFAAFIFIRQFFGQSFYAPSLDEFSSTEFFSGTAPYIIFINMIINYSTSVTPLFILTFFGVVYLFLKKEKQFSDWFLIFSFIAFSGILLDKRYVRMFVVPFLTFFIIPGVHLLFKFVKKKMPKVSSWVNPVLSIGMILLILVSIGSLYIRFQVLEEERGFADVSPYWETGQYIRTLDCDCSTVTTEELRAGVTIFASSGIPGASHNVYYFISKDKLQIQRLTLQTVKNMILEGRKVAQLWTARDWLFGGQYYIGKHGLYLFSRQFNEETPQQIIQEYNEKYYIHDKTLEVNNFYQSLVPFKNSIYDNPKAVVYEINRGRE